VVAWVASCDDDDDDHAMVEKAWKVDVVTK
jgi:hypothetical protein